LSLRPISWFWFFLVGVLFFFFFFFGLLFFLFWGFGFIPLFFFFFFLFSFLFQLKPSSRGGLFCNFIPAPIQLQSMGYDFFMRLLFSFREWGGPRGRRAFFLSCRLAVHFKGRCASPLRAVALPVASLLPSAKKSDHSFASDNIELLSSFCRLYVFESLFCRTLAKSSLFLPTF